MGSSWSIYRLAAFFILERKYMEHINGYDEYENDFKSVSRPEYKRLAEQMLLEALEINDQQNFKELYMPDYISNDDSGYTFRFQEQGGILSYTGFY